jgi:hypothetical protein
MFINIGRDLTCFGPDQSFDVLILKKERRGSHVLKVLSNIAKNGGGRMFSGCSQKLNFAPLPRTCL